MGIRLDKNFYLREDVVNIAKDLIGKWIFTNIDNCITGGIITETEAYEGETDKASHAYKGKRSERTKIMYYEGGTAYVYLCYGVHSLFNVVTNKTGIPHAILIRAIKPIIGIEYMSARYDNKPIKKNTAKGPGLVSKLLGIHYSYSGESLLNNKIWFEDKNTKFDKNKIVQTKRIGINYAEEDALLPYRFYISFDDI